MSDKKVNSFVDHVSKSFGKFLCGGNALKGIDRDDEMTVMEVASPRAAPMRSFSKSPSMSPMPMRQQQGGGKKLCALDFDLTLTQNQVMMMIAMIRQ